MATIEIWEIILAAPRRQRADSHAALQRIADHGTYASISLAHTDGLALIAAADCAVGVDVEHLGNVPDADELDDLVELTLSHREQADMRSTQPARQPRRWLELWTRKEAALKAFGNRWDDPAICDIDGLDHDVRELPVTGGYVAALASSEPDARLVRRSAVRV